MINLFPSASSFHFFLFISVVDDVVDDGDVVEGLQGSLHSFLSFSQTACSLFSFVSRQITTEPDILQIPRIRSRGERELHHDIISVSLIRSPWIVCKRPFYSIQMHAYREVIGHALGFLPPLTLSNHVTCMRVLLSHMETSFLLVSHTWDRCHIDLVGSGLLFFNLTA